MCSADALSTASCHQTSCSSSQAHQVLTGATYDQHLLDRVPLAGGLLPGLVDGWLQRRGRAAPVAAVGGDHELHLAVDQPGRQRVGGEPAEDHGVRCADPGAGQHRDDRLGDHRHVDRDPVAGLDAEVGQRVGRLADLVLQLGVGEVAGVVLGLADPVEGHPVAVALLDVPVDAVVRRVELAADVPLRERGVVPVEHPVPLGVPAQPLGLLGPEGLAILVGPRVRLLLEVGVGREVLGRLEAPVLLEQVRQGLFGHDVSRCVEWLARLTVELPAWLSRRPLARPGPLAPGRASWSSG